MTRMTVPSKPQVRTLRPSLVVAEALVDRHEPSEIVDRARRLGFSRCLTTAVVAACCRTETDARRPAPPYQTASASEASPS
jgi:hypothetical protein